MSRTRNRRLVGLPGLALAAALAVSACTPAAEESGSASGAAPGAGGITVADAWVRAAPAAGNSAAYMVLRNAGDDADRLVGASTDVAGMVQIHETVMEDGVASMVHQPDGVAVPTGASLTFEPGGLHIMLMDLRDDLVEGDTIALTLEFEDAGTVTVEAPVRAMAGGSPGAMDMGGG